MTILVTWVKTHSLTRIHPEKYFLHLHTKYLSNFAKFSLRFLIPALLCNYRYALDPVEHMDAGFKDYLTHFILIQSKAYWIRQQIVVWNDKYRPEMFGFLGRNGYGFAFNMMSPDKMFHKG